MMPRYWTHLWTTKTCRAHERQSGTLFDHTADNRLGKVEPNDYIYGVNVHGGAIHVLGRMKVKDVLSYDEACSVLDYAPWEADWHAVAEDGEATEMRFDRSVPLESAKQIVFLTSGGKKRSPIQFESPRAVHRQTLRGVRELTPQSAALLDEVLGE